MKNSKGAISCFHRVTQTAKNLQRITIDYPGTQGRAVLNNLEPGRVYNITVYALTDILLDQDHLFYNADNPPSVLAATSKKIYLLS